MGKIGFWELLIIFLVIVLLFGARRLPDLARSLGKSIGEFKKGREEGGKGGQSSADASESDKKA